MRRILVDPDYLRSLAAAYRRQAGDLKASFEQLNITVSSLDPEMRKTLGLDMSSASPGAVTGGTNGIAGDWDRARTQARNLIEQAEAQAHYLEALARRYEDADHESAVQVGQLFTDFEAAFSQVSAGWHPAGYTPPVPQELVSRVSALAGPASAGIAVTQVAGLAALVGVGAVATRKLAEGTRTPWSGALERAARAAVDKGAGQKENRENRG